MVRYPSRRVMSTKPRILLAFLVLSVVFVFSWFKLLLMTTISNDVVEPKDATLPSKPEAKADVEPQRLYEKPAFKVGNYEISDAYLRIPFAGADELDMEVEENDYLRDFRTFGSDEKRFKFPLRPAPEYLGVLLDGGRHFFPVPWVKRMLNVLAELHYNLLHFRLTDDQAFNVLLDSHPELAYPSSVNNPDRRVYSRNDLVEIREHAARLGISIMPEINVPGHAGGWAGAGVVLECPEFACDEGSAFPLDISKPQLRQILFDVIAEVVEIFDTPDFLHLGGDEFTLSAECLHEANVKTGVVQYYAEFETMLREVVEKVGYPIAQVVRWEMTGVREYPELLSMERTGKIEHLWHSPIERRNENVMTQDRLSRTFVSTGLYFDTFKEDTSLHVWAATRAIMENTSGAPPTAVIAGCFELSAEFWYDRNVIAKLIAVAMGAAGNSRRVFREANPDDKTVFDKWKLFCREMKYGHNICMNQGQGRIEYDEFRENLKAKWKIWKKDACNRLTMGTEDGLDRVTRSPVPPFFTIAGNK